MDPSVNTWLLKCIDEGRLPGEDTSSFSMELSRWETPRVKSAVYEHYRSQAGVRAKPMETFWRQLQQIVQCRTKQVRTAGWGDGQSRSVQMAEFPTLSECKAAFREHMADDGWVFGGEALEENSETSEDAMFEHGSKSKQQTTAPSARSATGDLPSSADEHRSRMPFGHSMLSLEEFDAILTGRTGGRLRC